MPSMDLSIQKLSKAYNRKTVFKDLNFDIRSGSKFAITGPNGSGKSTLLKILSGGSLASSGQIIYRLNGITIPDAAIFRHVHFAAPYNTVMEELTLSELFVIHQRLGLLRSFTSFDQWLDKLKYSFQPGQQIKMFSSGMKQRIKLGLILLDDRPLILLDEPGSNLDTQGRKWFFDLLLNLSGNQTLIIASNDPEEINICPELISLGDKVDA